MSSLQMISQSQPSLSLSTHFSLDNLAQFKFQPTNQKNDH